MPSASRPQHPVTATSPTTGLNTVSAPNGRGSQLSEQVETTCEIMAPLPPKTTTQATMPAGAKPTDRKWEPGTSMPNVD